jgi:hypothetical protein
MTNKDMLFIGTIIARTATVALGIAVTAINKVNRLCNRLNASLDEIESKTTIAVSDQLIDDVVTSMAERSLNKTVPTAVNKAVDNIKQESITRIKNGIDAEVVKYAPEIKTKLYDQVKDVKIDNMQKEVVQLAAIKVKKGILDSLVTEQDDAIREIRRKRDDLKDELQDAVDDMKRELEDEAKDKFDEKVEDITSRYKGRLDDISTIYSSFANKLGN